MDQDDIETIMSSSDDQAEFTITLRASRKLSTADVILELEYLLNELSRADEQQQSGVGVH